MIELCIRELEYQCGEHSEDERVEVGHPFKKISFNISHTLFSHISMLNISMLNI